MLIKAVPEGWLEDEQETDSDTSGRDHIRRWAIAVCKSIYPRQEAESVGDSLQQLPG